MEKPGASGTKGGPRSVEPTTPAARLALLERRLARSEAARAAAENLLEQKSRILAAANAELEARKQDLSASLERRTRQLLDAQRVAGFGTMIWDIRGHRMELSPNLRLLCGLDADRDIHSFRPLVRRVVAADRSKLLRWIRDRLFASLSCRTCAADQRVDACQSPDLRIKIRCRSGDGGPDIVWLSVMAQLEYDARCRASLLFVTVQDVTRQMAARADAEASQRREQRRLKELEQLNAQLSVARENAESANAAKSRFLAMMSHDIRTPLNGIIGLLDLLEEDGLRPGQRRALDLVRSSGEQLRVLLNDIIDLARAEAGRLKLDPAPCQPAVVLEERGSFWRHLADQKDLELRVELSPRIPGWIAIDAVRLRQLVDNLLSNAVKYTRAGSILFAVDYIDNARLRVEVSDTGIGIPEGRMAELFEDFGQLHLHGAEPGGAGLGLAICRRIIDVMGGRIGVTPVARGAAFWFEIPCTPISGPPRVVGPATVTLAGRDGRPLRVLVAEDLATNRIVVQGHLRRLGCDVTLVPDGLQAVQAVAKGGFDLVLMDMAMPVMDGTEATRCIRALSGGSARVPIIALTAFARAEELAPIFAAGANGHAAKPIVADELRAVMAEVLDASR
ncbi:MAG: ATP-binding protein [Sphingopyxis sp.]|uniref:ATP-binding protein n=1 Tax=Sphingopyxis sp. TaxID=1908224 RepID=UPI002AB8BC26|nr:ATP-binding protein [Sphingopyxis sp.]MDZ3830806.1 ATP-binding protein [Sphingopyxis sp.]